MNSQEHGFSLIELIIVVLVIAIIAVIAIPNLLAARRSANEGSAISSLRTLHSAQMTFQTSRGAGNYAGTNSNTADTVGLGILQSNKLIDEVLGNGFKNGYVFSGATAVSSANTPATFFFSANPNSSTGITQSGTRRYNITQVGVLRGDWSNLAIPFDATTVYGATPLSN